MIISFEGMDGSGKTTQAHRLASRLGAGGRQAVVLPLFRNDNVEFMLDALDSVGGMTNEAARLAVLAKVVARDEYLISDLLRRGTVVIYDKFLMTHLATELMRGARTAEFAAVVPLVRQPDLAFLFRIDPHEAVRRKDTLGYRESGLDLEEAAGRCTYQDFKAGAYSTEWLTERFLEFQGGLLELLTPAPDGPIAQTLPYAADAIPVPMAAGIDEVAELVSAMVEEALAQRVSGAT